MLTEYGLPSPALLLRALLHGQVGPNGFVWRPSLLEGIKKSLTLGDASLMIGSTILDWLFRTELEYRFLLAVLVSSIGPGDLRGCLLGPPSGHLLFDGGGRALLAVPLRLPSEARKA